MGWWWRLMRARVQVRELGWEWKPYASWRAVLARFTSAQLLMVRRLLHTMWDAAVQHIMWDAAVQHMHAVSLAPNYPAGWPTCAAAG
jgi:hypothetical protein